jgi:hypothetical protein
VLNKSFIDGGRYFTLLLSCSPPLLHDHASELVMTVDGDCKQNVELGYVSCMDCIMLSVIYKY